MKNQLLLLLSTLMVGCTADSVVTEESLAPNQEQPTRMIHLSQKVPSKTLFVKFREDYGEKVESSIQHAKSSGRASRSGIDAFDAFLSNNSALSIERIFPKGKFEARTRKSGLHLWYKVTFTSPLSSSEIQSQLKNMPGISTVEIPAQIRSVYDGTFKLANQQIAAPASPMTSQSNDPYLSLQWGYNNDGTLFEGCRQYSDINLFNAWKRSTGDPSVIVAVVDGGVQYNHPDLQDNMWVNQAEMDGEPGVDDDENGFVDDVYGYDFVDMQPNIVPSPHGTHVAGTIAAVNNNGIGVSGIAGGSGHSDGVRIMTCGIFDAQSNGSLESASHAAKFAADNGAVISQNSWSYVSPDVNWEEMPDFSLERESYQYFIDYAGKDENGNVTGPLDGGIVIFSAGNDGNRYGTTKFWPSASSSFISVSSVGADFNPAYYTCHGNWVDLAAPGGDMVFVSNRDDMGGILSTCIAENPDDYVYAFMQGTSMACPHVSGVAALAVSYAKANNKTLTNSELKNILFSSTKPIDHLFHGTKDFEGNSKFPAFHLNMADYSGLMGNGLIDASLVLDNIDKMVGKSSDHVQPQPVGDVELMEALPTSIAVKWKATADYTNAPLSSYAVYFSEEPIQLVNKKVQINKQVQGPLMVNAADSKVGDWMECNIKDLKPDNTYYLAVVGIDQWRSEAEPRLAQFNTAEIPGGKPVENLKVTEVGTGSMNLEWTETSDFFGEPYVAYHIYYSENSDFSDAEKKVIRSKGKVGAQCKVSISGLKSGVTYYVKVVGYDMNDIPSVPAEITCTTQVNKAPVITPAFSLPVSLQYWNSASLAFDVKDPDGDTWTAKLLDSADVWTLETNEDKVILTFKAPVDIEGKAKVSFRVTDAKGGEADYLLEYQVIANENPVLKANLADVYFSKIGNSQAVALDEFFSDPNGEPLKYDCKVDGVSVNGVLKEGSLTLKSLKNGLSTVEVTATDGRSKSVTSTFKVMVRESASSMDLYPNPVKDVMNIRMGQKVEGTIKVSVRGTDGKIVMNTEAKISPYAPAKVDLSSLRAGYLWVDVEYQGEVYKGNVVKL